MKYDLLELTFTGKKPVEVEVRRGTFSLAASSLSYVEWDSNPEWRVYIPLHRLDTWRYLNRENI